MSVLIQYCCWQIILEDNDHDDDASKVPNSDCIYWLEGMTQLAGTPIPTIKTVINQNIAEFVLDMLHVCRLVQLVLALLHLQTLHATQALVGLS